MSVYAEKESNKIQHAFDKNGDYDDEEDDETLLSNYLFNLRAGTVFVL